jgi:tetratricopeptide (TPR) repeat protein
MRLLTTVAAALLSLAAAAPVVAAQPGVYLAEARRQFAAGRYNEAASAYRRCLDESPADTTVLGELATALDAAGRWPEAVPYLERLVAMSPPDARRLTTLAQFLAWTGAHRRAGELFARAYALDSTNVVLLAAYGEYLTWRTGTSARGISLLGRAVDAEPRNAVARERLANAELERGRYMSAAKLVAPLAPSVRVRGSLADSLVRATDVSFRVGARAERRTGQLSADGLLVGTTRPLGYGRVSLDAEPMELRDGAGSFRAIRGALAYEYRDPSTPQIEAVAGGWGGLEPGRSLWEARLAARSAPSFPVGLSVGVDRAPITETRRSLTGIVTAGIRRGAVNATTVRAGARASLGAVELTVDGASGVIDGESLDRNRRTGMSGMVAWTARPHAPWMRLGYEFRSQRFRFNAFDDSANVQRFGGYFSPHSDRAHLGMLQLSQRLGPRLLLEVDARAGREMVQMAADRARERQTAAVVYSHLVWRAARTLDLDASYLHVNVLTAFRMHETRLAMRRFF